MKNIHVLPTDKPSELYINMQGDLSKSNSLLLRLKSRNIYITNDEEIKEGDWYIGQNGFQKKCVGTTIISNEEAYLLDYLDNTDKVIWCKKIILTTDDQLITDGVQAIDDEFLEWFVKNPSCEFAHLGFKSIIGDSETKTTYKIIIPKEELSKDEIDKYFVDMICNPKEEPKQCDICKMYPRLEGTNKCESCYSSVRHVLEQDPKFKGKLLPDLRKKQETLEEAAEEHSNEMFSKNGDLNSIAHTSFIKGAKWQAERMYSEEEVRKLIVDFLFVKGIGKEVGSVNEWFEQIKKK